MIVFVSQEKISQLFPLIENRPAALFQVAGKTIVEWFYENGKNYGVEKVILLADKNDRKLLYKALGDYQEVSAPINEIGPFTIIDFEPDIGITKEILDILYKGLLSKNSIWLDGNVVFSSTFLNEFLEKAEGTGKVALVEDEKKKCLGIGYFDKDFLDSCALKAKCVNDIFTEVNNQTRSLTHTLVFEKEKMEFWQINYLWNLLDANQILINSIGEKKEGTIEKGATIIGKVSIGDGTRIRAGSYLEGPLAIGKNCDIGPNCYLRKGVSLGNEVRIGNGCEIKNTIVFDGTHIAHLSYVGDSIIGIDCNFGAGTITGNLRLDDKSVKTRVNGKKISTGRRKIGVIMGDYVKTAIDVFFMPGVTVGNNSAIGTGVIVHRNIGSNRFVRIAQEVYTDDWIVVPKEKKKKG
jgi:NDP-sugar pyrophosphorylase family protein